MPVKLLGHNGGCARSGKWVNDQKRLFDYTVGQIADDASARIQKNTFHYDTAGRLNSSTDAEQHTETTTWDGLGNRLSLTNKNGAIWRYEYDARRQLVTETAAESAVTTLTASGDGLLAATVTAEHPAQTVSTVSYDMLGNAVSSRDVAGNASYKQYDRLGRVKYDIDAEGWVSSYARNAQVRYPHRIQRVWRGHAAGRARRGY